MKQCNGTACGTRTVQTQNVQTQSAQMLEYNVSDEPTLVQPMQFPQNCRLPEPYYGCCCPGIDPNCPVHSKQQAEIVKDMYTLLGVDKMGREVTLIVECRTHAEYRA